MILKEDFVALVKDLMVEYLPKIPASDKKSFIDSLFSELTDMGMESDHYGEDEEVGPDEVEELDF